MLSPEEYMPLENAIASLRREAPELLKAIAKAINSFDPHLQVSQNAVAAWEYGKPTPNFAITNGQLGVYLDIAVSKYASVLIETEVGVLQSQHVRINREWLLTQREQVTYLSEVANAITINSSGSKGATVTPIRPHLEDQTPDTARAELRKLNIRIERSLIIRGDDHRDQEIQRLNELLNELQAEKTATVESEVALTRMVKTLSLENDQLRKAREEKNAYIAAPSPSISQLKKTTPSNVEIFNAEKRKAREAVCLHAKKLWAHPELAGYRTRKMAEIVRKSVDEDLLKHLPQTDEILAKWLSEDAAPPSAKRKGRPSKSDPNK